MEWAKLYRRYQARLAILEPQDGHVAGSMTIKHGMSCAIRYQVTDDTRKSCSQTLGSAVLQFAGDASTSNQAYGLPFADLDDPITPKAPGTGGPLRGGVTWGFESRNIFCATLRNEFSTADSAAVSDLDFTALGGFGHQQASFDEGRTSIFGDAAMGRTYFYKLERIGRIAVFWNKAKHVIVYERSVVPSRQFFNEQDDGKQSYGVPMLRKIEEYVEILEEERRFPDDHVLTNATGGNGTPSQRCGNCVAACVRSRRAARGFPFSSSVGKRRQHASTGRPNANPRGLESAAVEARRIAGRRVSIPQDLAVALFRFRGKQQGVALRYRQSGGRLLLHRHTRRHRLEDTDKWAPILGVDTTGRLPAAGAGPGREERWSADQQTLMCPFRWLKLCLHFLAAAAAVRTRTSWPIRVSTGDGRGALGSVTMMPGCTQPREIRVDPPDLRQHHRQHVRRCAGKPNCKTWLRPSGWTIANLANAVSRDPA